MLTIHEAYLIIIFPARKDNNLFPGMIFVIVVILPHDQDEDETWNFSPARQTTQEKCILMYIYMAIQINPTSTV